MLSVLHQIGKAPPEQIGTVLSQLKGSESPMGIHGLFTTQNAKDIGTSAPVQEVQPMVQPTVEAVKTVVPKAKSILEQLLPKGEPTTFSVQAEAQVQQATVATEEAKQPSPVSSLFGGQLQIGS